jgi:hypothetical protein
MKEITVRGTSQFVLSNSIASDYVMVVQMVWRCTTDERKKKFTEICG